MFNKTALIKQFTSEIALELKALTQAAQNTYDEATHEDNKAENKYDTRSLEASYLAGAQAQRVNEMKDVLAIFENLPIKDFNQNSNIQATALVEVYQANKSSHVLIMPKGGGQSTRFENELIQVITPESPLGKALLGKKTGDQFEIQKGSKKIEYEIITVY